MDGEDPLDRLGRFRLVIAFAIVNRQRICAPTSLIAIAKARYREFDRDFEEDDQVGSSGFAVVVSDGYT